MNSSRPLTPISPFSATSRVQSSASKRADSRNSGTIIELPKFDSRVLYVIEIDDWLTKKVFFFFLFFLSPFPRDNSVRVRLHQPLKGPTSRYFKRRKHDKKKKKFLSLPQFGNENLPNLFFLVFRTVFFFSLQQ